MLTGGGYNAIDNSEGFLCPRALQAEGGMLSWSMRAVFPLFRLNMISGTLILSFTTKKSHKSPPPLLGGKPSWLLVLGYYLSPKISNGVACVKAF